MADNVIYSHRDENGDRLRVECWPETIEVDAEDANGKYGASVSLPREEGINLARAILAALDAERELTPRQLDALPVGSEVYDADGDMWTKQPDQRWQWGHYSPRTSHSLVDTYGPVTAKDGVGSSRHADKAETGDTP